LIFCSESGSVTAGLSVGFASRSCELTDLASY
jgi:hypothetical protein